MKYGGFVPYYYKIYQFEYVQFNLQRIPIPPLPSLSCLKEPSFYKSSVILKPQREQQIHAATYYRITRIPFKDTTSPLPLPHLANRITIRAIQTAPRLLSDANDRNNVSNRPGRLYTAYVNIICGI